MNENIPQPPDHDKEKPIASNDLIVPADTNPDAHNPESDANGPDFVVIPTDSSFEAQLTHLQETITQWWQRLKETPPQEPGTVVILGQVFENEVLDSQVVANAMNKRIWCTYRCGFEPIQRAVNGPAPLSFITSMIFNTISAKSLFLFDNSVFHTDVGWGCMIRTSQSLLANTFQRLVENQEKSKDGLISGALASKPLNAEASSGLTQSEIISLFGDNYESPFSLHNFVQAASQLPLEVKPGEWFGPSAASLSIKRLCNKYSSTSLPPLRVHISESSGLSNEEVATLFEQNKDPILVLFPVRLGIENVNKYYYPSIFELLSLPQSVGIAGGKPSSSYYFVGYSGSNLLYLDPHNLQMVSQDLSLYHTSRCQTLPVSSLDPLMLVGILLLDMSDYECLKRSLEKTNKIISFLDHPKKKHGAGDDYIRIKSQGTPIDDYVDVSDQFSGENLSLDESESATELEMPPSQDDSFDKFDIVERPT